MAVTTNKYASVVDTLQRPLPAWITDEDDQMRVGAYDGYDDMFKNVPATFRLVMRGEEDRPIYVPSSEIIIEATNRYLGKGWNWSVSVVGEATSAAEPQRLEVERALGALFTREEVPSKFFSIKRNLLKLGDALWHITYEPSMAAGYRLSISELSPRNFFRIPHPMDVEKLSGCYLVELIYADDGKTQIARRQEYRYTETGTVFAQMTFWEANAWDDRWIGHPALKPVATPAAYRTPSLAPLLGGYELPTAVRTIPVYHMRNKRSGGDPFGTSQIAGVETLIAGINQTASDEDITLALQGLGLYVTDSPRPVNDDGEEVDWTVAPGYVLEIRSGGTFQRVAGVDKVLPFQEHLAYLADTMRESKGLSNTAIGRVDVQVAQSGVALRLEMAPILAANEEKETELLSRMDQMLFDLVTMWLPLDGVSVAPGLTVINSFSDPLPVDRAGTIAEITTLVTAGLMSREFAIAYLTAKLGFQFPADMLGAILTEEDTVGARLAAEAAGAGVATDEGIGSIGEPAGAAPSVPEPVPTPVG